MGNRLYSSFFKQNTNIKERVQESKINDESEYLRKRYLNEDAVTQQCTVSQHSTMQKKWKKSKKSTYKL